MSTALSIENTHRIGLKETFKISFGRAVAMANPTRTKELFENPIAKPTGLRDKSIMAMLKHRAIAESQETFFERLHQDFWSGQGGAVFAENCDHRFEDLFLARQKEDFDKLSAIWDQRRPEHIVEFGCNSGLVLNYMTQQLTGVKSSIGIDINADQVNANQASDDFDPRIEFLHADGAQWLLDNGRANCLFVSNGGVLEYFQRARLNEMLTHIADHLRPAIFCAMEPVAADHDLANVTSSIPFGEELSFSHNYRDLFESNGFNILHQRLIDFESWKMMATIAVID